MSSYDGRRLPLNSLAPPVPNVLDGGPPTGLDPRDPRDTTDNRVPNPGSLREFFYFSSAVLLSPPTCLPLVLRCTPSGLNSTSLLHPPAPLSDPSRHPLDIILRIKGLRPVDTSEAGSGEVGVPIEPDPLGPSPVTPPGPGTG